MLTDPITRQPITRFDLFCEVGMVRRRLRHLAAVLWLSPVQAAERAALEAREAELMRQLDEMEQAS